MNKFFGLENFSFRLALLGPPVSPWKVSRGRSQTGNLINEPITFNLLMRRSRHQGTLIGETPTKITQSVHQTLKVPPS